MNFMPPSPVSSSVTTAERWGVQVNLHLFISHQTFHFTSRVGAGAVPVGVAPGWGVGVGLGVGAGPGVGEG
ncbi:MAG: hypothetical protein ACYTFG_11270, partial [Planctomycetota bacterium]